eukprot:1184424-Lingulodinium_polyedra.AAC.1
MLASTFSPGAGEVDFDTDNDGVPDSVGTLGFVYDAIGIPLEGDALLYASAVGGTDLAFTGTVASLVFLGRGSNTVFQVIGSSVFTAAGENADAAFGDQPFTVRSFGSLNP